MANVNYNKRVKANYDTRIIKGNYNKAELTQIIKNEGKEELYIIRNE